MKKQQGFTLVEMILVILLVAILGAYVAPRYFSIETDARRSTVTAFAGTVRVASEMVHSTAVARAVDGGGSVTMEDGRTVIVGTSRYPAANAAGIINSLVDVNGFSITYSTDLATFAKSGVSNGAACGVSYAYDDTGSVAPTITATTTDCS